MTHHRVISKPARCIISDQETPPSVNEPDFLSCIAYGLTHDETADLTGRSKGAIRKCARSARRGNLALRIIRGVERGQLIPPNSAAGSRITEAIAGLGATPPSAAALQYVREIVDDYSGRNLEVLRSLPDSKVHPRLRELRKITRLDNFLAILTALTKAGLLSSQTIPNEAARLKAPMAAKAPETVVEAPGTNAAYENLNPEDRELADAFNRCLSEIGDPSQTNELLLSGELATLLVEQFPRVISLLRDGHILQPLQNSPVELWIRGQRRLRAEPKKFFRVLLEGEDPGEADDAIKSARQALHAATDIEAAFIAAWLGELGNLNQL